MILSKGRKEDKQRNQGTRVKMEENENLGYSSALLACS